MDNLLAILSYRRPAFSKTERKMIRRFISPTGAKPDAFGNYILRIGEAPILWSCHTDTVHSAQGRQRVHTADGVAFTDPTERCLGADCGVGVWLMLEMIHAGVEGLYIFHRSEEMGGVGSRWLAANRPKVLEGIRFAIAFDRYGTTEIITHQRGKYCASTPFAASLSAALVAAGGPRLEASSRGIFTDTVSYAELIPECTNIAVGYIGHHTGKETQDLLFAERLRDALVSADFSGLVVARDPKEEPPAPAFHYPATHRAAHGYTATTELDYTTPAPARVVEDEAEDAPPNRVVWSDSFDALVRVLKLHPEAAADLLDQCGITAADVLDNAHGARQVS